MPSVIRAYPQPTKGQDKAAAAAALGGVGKRADSLTSVEHTVFVNCWSAYRACRGF